jgi:hypothetical protein
LELIAGGCSRKSRLAEIAEHNIVREIDSEKYDIIQHQNSTQRKEFFIKAFFLC